MSPEQSSEGKPEKFGFADERSEGYGRFNAKRGKSPTAGKAFRDYTPYFRGRKQALTSHYFVGCVWFDSDIHGYFGPADPEEC